MTSGRFPAASGRDPGSVTLDAVRDGDVAPEDIRIHPATLQAQAEVARTSGNAQLAENFERAAELAGLPDEEILAIYELLRPGRATAEEITLAADRLQAMGAVRNAALVLEAGAVYARRGLLKR